MAAVSAKAGLSGGTVRTAINWFAINHDGIERPRYCGSVALSLNGYINLEKCVLKIKNALILFVANHYPMYSITLILLHMWPLSIIPDDDLFGDNFKAITA